MVATCCTWFLMKPPVRRRLVTPMLSALACGPVLTPVPRGPLFVWLVRVLILSAGVIHRNYQTLLKAVGLGPDDGRSYNLLFTESWMMVVPRSREKWQGVGFNSMAFSGIVVLPQEKLGEFSAAPLALLRTISVPVQE